MRILIIEDEVTLNKTLAEGLKEFGYQSDVVETLKDGEYYLDIRNYDLILMDWMLPDGNSVDIIPDIKTNTPKTVIVVLSARDDNESEIEALRAGADDYIRILAKLARLLVYPDFISDLNRVKSYSHLIDAIKDCERLLE